MVFNNETGAYDLLYNNIGGAIMYLGINSTYWNYQVVVSTINGTVHNNYIDQWLKNVNASHPFYNLFNVYAGWNDTVPSGRKLLKPGYICADLMFQSFEAMYHFGYVVCVHLQHWYLICNFSGFLHSQFLWFSPICNSWFSPSSTVPPFMAIYVSSETT